MGHNNTPMNRHIEAELLLACARTNLDAEAAQRISQLLSRELDWNYLIRKASWHGLLPLLYWNLRGNNSDVVPTELWGKLEAHFHWNTKRCLLLTGELFKILDLFTEHGIKACPFKGPVLAASLYQNIGLRSFGDLDILVPRQDIHRAVNLMSSLGYAGSPTEEPIDVDIEPADVDPETIGYFQPHHYALTRNSALTGLGNIRIDLQWRISETHFAFSLDSDDRWSKLEPITILNRQVPSFALDDLFLILCVHGCKHYWYRIKWICDIAEILRANQTHDWSRCLGAARTRGVERMVKLGIFLAQDLLGAPLPSQLSERIANDARVATNARWIAKRLFAESEGRTSTKRALLFYLDMKDSWSDRITHCALYVWQFIMAIMTPTQKERAAVHLPKSLQFLYYVIRPLRLSAKHLRSALRRIQKSEIRPRPV
jgi:hypothetical protein